MSARSGAHHVGPGWLLGIHGLFICRLLRRPSLPKCVGESPGFHQLAAKNRVGPRIHVRGLLCHSLLEQSVVKEAIGQLPQRQRMAIELVHFRGLTYAKAAAEMETTRKAIKSLLVRGRAALEETLEVEYCRRFETSP